jgi:glycosyltransferase involved in cell wall biosynthesis
VNILLVSELFPFCDAAGELHMLGGGEHHMYALGRELSRRHHIVVLTSHVPAATYPEDRFPFHVCTIYNRKTAGKRAANLRYAVRLSRELRRISNQFDVIVPQTFIPVFSASLSRTKVPVVPIVHDVYQPLPLANGISAWRDLQGGDTLRGVQGCLLERACLRYASTCPITITVSDPTFETLRYWIPRHKIRVTGNGIYPQEFAQNTKEIDVICIARFDAPYKNIDIVCEALFDTEVQTVIVGNGKLLPTLERRWASENIQFAGHVSEGRKKELLSKSKILLSASSVEGFGITLLEGLASGCLVAASDIAPHRFIDHGSNIIKFFPVGDSEATKSAVIELLQLSGEERASLRKRANSLISRYWNWQAIAHKTEIFLDSVAQTHRP